MTKHTPGPWIVMEGQADVYTAGSAYGCGQMYIAQCRGWGHLTGRGGGAAMDPKKAGEIQDANARLIAAAPDLLAELRSAAEIIHDLSLAIAQSIPVTHPIYLRDVRSAEREAVIAKAEGR